MDFMNAHKQESRFLEEIVLGGEIILIEVSKVVPIIDAGKQKITS